MSSPLHEATGEGERAYGNPTALKQSPSSAALLMAMVKPNFSEARKGVMLVNPMRRLTL
jgi:hypothetical protein